MSKIFDLITENPATNAELPKTFVSDMDPKYRNACRKIKTGTFTTVYYTAGDETRAITKFVEVNYDKLARVSEIPKKLQSTLPVDIIRKITSEFARRQRIKVYATHLIFMAIQCQDADNEGAILRDPGYEMFSISSNDSDYDDFGYDDTYP